MAGRFTGERAEVLITVKASPEPSEAHGDTVCVAGVRLDVYPHKWIRLYPVPFRWLSSDRQFDKFEAISVDLLQPHNDNRAESYRIDGESVERSNRKVGNGPARGAILEPLIGPSMCDLVDGVHADPTAQSLGLVRARQLTDVYVKPHPGWSTEQQRKIDQGQAQMLFGEPPPPLIAPPFLTGFKYKCDRATCRGHEQRNLDWEATALQLNLRRLSPPSQIQAIRQRYLDERCAPDKAVHFFVGNMGHPTKRRSFSILGVYGPPKQARYADTLDLGV